MDFEPWTLEFVFSLNIGFWTSIVDALVKSRNCLFSVIPVKTGIQCFQELLDAGSSPA